MNSKAIVFLSAVLMAGIASPRPVTVDEAHRAARAISGRNHEVGDVVGVLPWSFRGNTIGYVAKGTRKTVLLSADTGMPPVIAIVDGGFQTDGVSGLMTLLVRDVSTAALCVSSLPTNSPKLKVSSQSSRPLPLIIESNELLWNDLFGSSSRRDGTPLKASVLSADEDYVIPGFEEGGVYTHWGQDVSGELKDVEVVSSGSPTVGYCAWPFYNSYIVWENVFGFAGGLGATTMPMYSTYHPGLRLVPFSAEHGGPAIFPDSVGMGMHLYASGYRMRNFYPCGCSATAYAAMFQCMGVTGCVSVAGSVYAPHEPSANPYLWYDRYRVCTNYVSSLGPIFSVDDPPAVYDPEVSEEYYRAANTIPGTFDWSVLPWNCGGRSKTNLYYGVELTQRLLVSGTSASADFSRLPESVMTPGARELCGRVTYNLGVLLGMTYRKSISTAKTGDLIGRVRRGDVFPGFGSYGFVSDSWDGNVVGRIIRAGNPVAVSIYAEELGGHAVLAVGRKKIMGLDFTRLFMGWNGKSDAWVHLDGLVDVIIGGYRFTEIRGMYAIGGYDGAALPVHGKVVDQNGKPVGGVPVVLTNVRDGLDTNLRTGPDGYYRGWVRSVSRGDGASETDDFTYTISCNGDQVSGTANSYRLGDGPADNQRYSDLATWSSQFPQSSHVFTVQSRRNGHAYGSPDSFDDVLADAAKAFRLVAVVVGRDGRREVVDEFVDALGTVASNVSVYFLDRSQDEWFARHEDGPALLLVDPNVFDKGGPWTRENGVVKYGAFDNAYDFGRIVSDAWYGFDRKYLWSDRL